MATGNCEWQMANGELGMENREWEMGNGKWEIENGILVFQKKKFHSKWHAKIVRPEGVYQNLI